MRPARARCTLLKDAGAPYTAVAGAIYTDTCAGAPQTEKAGGMHSSTGTGRPNQVCVALSALPVQCSVEAVDIYGG